MLVCLCKAVPERRVRSAIREGARTVTEVGRATGAGTDCGACREMIAQILQQETSREASGEAERQPTPQD